MLDHYVWGTVTRISPEAPVPVVNVTSESILLGGAANVLHNIVSLGGKGTLCGVIGQDEAGQRLLSEMRRLGVDTKGIAVEEGRPTTSKTRIIAHNQQVVRFDQENKKPVSQKSKKKILEYIYLRAPEVDSILLSDYAKGVIGEDLVQEIRTLSKELRIPVVVDPKVQHVSFYREVNIITPNHHEASQASGIEIEDERSLVKAGRSILERLDCRAVLITRGEQGMSLFEAEGNRVTHIPTVAKQVYDVTGAGDTVIGTLALCIAAGAGLVDACRLANYAAGVVVGMVGTAAVSREALAEALK
jgi:rfaE bifunctional protein kinase chain/domain